MPLNKISLERQREIEDLVKSIKLSTGLSYPEDSLERIIKSSISDVSIVEDDFNGNAAVRGAIFRQSKEYAHPLIAIQSHQSKGAKTFALAHEFGHFMLDHNPKENYLIDDRPFNGTRLMQDEGEANFFAACLLMPKALFRKLDKGLLTDEQLAQRFGVTPSAVSVRRDWLNQNDEAKA